MAEHITITIHTGNAAFEDYPATEIAACLRRLADRFERDGTPSRVMDSNGNAVGTVDIRQESFGMVRPGRVKP